MEDEHDDQGVDNSMKTSGLQGAEERATEDDIETLQKLLEGEKKKSEDYLSRLKYLQADLENYRKRVDREVRELSEFSTVSLIRKLLPVLDDLDLAIASVGEGEQNKGVREGMKMVQKNLCAALEGEGLRRIDAVGKPFDPHLHEAVDKVHGDDSGEDIVVEEMRKGYMFKDKVLRPSAVKVRLAAKPEKGHPNNRMEGETA